MHPNYSGNFVMVTFIMFGLILLPRTFPSHCVTVTGQDSSAPLMQLSQLESHLPYPHPPFMSWSRKPYFHVHILSSFGHACSQAQPLAWPVTVSVVGGNVMDRRAGLYQKLCPSQSSANNTLNQLFCCCFMYIILF